METNDDLLYSYGCIIATWLSKFYIQLTAGKTILQDLNIDRFLNPILTPRLTRQKMSASRYNLPRQGTQWGSTHTIKPGQPPFVK